MSVDDSEGEGIRRRSPDPSHTYTFIFIHIGSLPTWTEDRVPRWTFYQILWIFREGVATSEVTENLSEA